MYGNYGGAIVAIAIGAILRWAVTGHVNGVALGTLGLIIMLAGVVWLLLALLYDSSYRRREPGGAVAERERIVERDDRLTY